MHVLVTGAAGHLGFHLVPELLSAGFEVTGFDVAEPPGPVPEGCRFLCADLTDVPTLTRAVGEVTLIVHCASLHPWKTYTDEQYLDANIEGTWNLYAAAVASGVDRIVLTSSIAATGYQNVPTDAWPIREDAQFPLGDLYSFTKHAQEDIARSFAHREQVRTIALRPPAFFPRPDLETGFLLTGNFALVDDMVSAHVAAVRVMSGLQEPGGPLCSFEAIHVTNKLPYTPQDAELLEPGRGVRRLVQKYWPEAYEWLVGHGYQGASLAALYDLSRAQRILGWQPVHNFEQWFAQHNS